MTQLPKDKTEIANSWKLFEWIYSI